MYSYHTIQLQRLYNKKLWKYKYVGVFDRNIIIARQVNDLWFLLDKLLEIQMKDHLTPVISNLNIRMNYMLNIFEYNEYLWI